LMAVATALLPVKLTGISSTTRSKWLPVSSRFDDASHRQRRPSPQIETCDDAACNQSLHETAPAGFMRTVFQCCSPNIYESH
jgi:hypothetical protein